MRFPTIWYMRPAKLLTEQHLEFLSLQGGCTGSCESTFVKMPLYHGSNANWVVAWLQEHRRMHSSSFMIWAFLN